MCRLDMEVDRLLCDDGLMLPSRPTAGKAQRDRGVQGWADSGQHAGSRMRPVSRGPALVLLTCSRVQQQQEYRFKGILGTRKSTAIYSNSAVNRPNRRHQING